MSQELHIQTALIGLGVHPGNIKTIANSPGFQKRSNRYVVIFYRNAGLSAAKVNTAPGLENAVFDGNKLVVDVQS